MKMERQMGLTLVILTVFLIIMVDDVEGGECCKAHDGIFGVYANDRKWCDNYCCFQLKSYDCCDDILLQAPASERMDTCPEWFESHAWAPVLISLAILGAIIGAIVCCCCCCCAACRISSRPGTVMMPQNQPNVMVVQTATPGVPHAVGPPNPYSVGYDQQADVQYK